MYERLFSESFLYFYRNRDRYSNRQVVAIYPSRSLEQSELQPYQVLLNSDQVHRVYLDELGEIRQLPLGIALMLLTTVEEEQAPEEARYLLARSQRETADSETSRAIMEMVTTIMLYKFITLNRVEVEAMIGIRLQETRVYQETRAEEAVTLILRQLPRRLKQELPGELRTRITALPLPSLEALAEALLDFSTLADLEAWLAANS